MSREYPDRPWIGIGVIAFRGEEVLLVRRGKPPRLGSWSLPGGAQHLGETAQEAARRELLEETGIEVGPLLLADVVDAVTHDEAGAVRYHYTIVDFCGEWTGGEARAGDDVDAVAWAPPEALDAYALTREAQAVIALARLRIRVDAADSHPGRSRPGRSDATDASSPASAPPPAEALPPR